MTTRRALTALFVSLYLAAFAAATLIIKAEGKAAVLYVGAALIGFNLVARDRLHDLFGTSRVGRAWKMALLIVAGATIGYLLNHDALRIAQASALAFAAGETVDFIVYEVLRRHEWLVRSNVSQLLAAPVDTIVFFAWAFQFHGVTVELVFAQIMCKIAGGVFYTLLLNRRRALLPRHA